MASMVSAVVTRRAGPKIYGRGVSKPRRRHLPDKTVLVELRWSKREGERANHERCLAVVLVRASLPGEVEDWIPGALFNGGYVWVYGG